MTPSLKTAQAELSRRLGRIDAWHNRQLDALPAGHTWRDIDELEIERCNRTLDAHADFKAAEAEWNAYLVAHGNDE